jgi:hypothetical protein
VRREPDEDAIVAKIPVGTRRPGQARTITAGEIMLLAAVSEFSVPSTDVVHLIDSESILIDAESIVLDAHLVLPLVLSLAAGNPLFRDLEHVHSLVTVAALSHRCVLGEAVHAGDTIMTESKILAIRRSSSRPGHYVMTIRDIGVNERGAEVAVIDRVILVRHDGRDHQNEGTDS